MHWKKIIPVVFFGIFLVSQIVTSIYAQEQTTPVPNVVDSEPKTEVTVSEPYAWFDENTAAFWGIIVAVFTSAIGIIYQAREFHRARQERNMSIVEGYSSQITELKNKERALQTKYDCETYAQNYLDLMDQIAYLCKKERGIPKDVRKYFENDFAYALTIMWWLKEHNLIRAEPIEDFFKEPIPKVKPSENEHREDNKTNSIDISDDYKSGIQEFKDESFPWHDLILWCLDKTDKELITPFDDDQLPNAMYFYEQLHEEDIEGTLRVVQEYGAKLIELTKDEPKLKKILEWETYATVYLDTLDSIAYLLLNNIIPKGVDQYFENNFSYGLTMLEWLEKKKLVEPITIVSAKEEKTTAKEKGKMKFVDWNIARKKVDKEYPWADFLNWCEKKKIEPYDDSYLPKKMKDPDPE